eukprot:1587988-Rhodomonas_salina.1
MAQLPQVAQTTKKYLQTCQAGQLTLHLNVTATSMSPQGAPWTLILRAHPVARPPALKGPINRLPAQTLPTENARSAALLRVQR